MPPAFSRPSSPSSAPPASSAPRWPPRWNAPDTGSSQVTRATLPALLETRRNAGHVIDCIGLTGDFRTRPHDTAEAHVGVTARCLAGLHFASFLFLSSTRVYAPRHRDSRSHTAHLRARRPVRPLQPHQARRRSRLPRRSAPDGARRPPVQRLRRRHAERHIPRPSCSGRASGTGVVRFRQSAKSTKDYVSLAEVTRLLPAIATERPAPALQPRRRRQHQPRRHCRRAAPPVRLARRVRTRCSRGALPADRHRPPDRSNSAPR